MESDSVHFLGSDFLREIIDGAFKKLKRPPRNLDRAWDTIESKLAIPGVVVEHIDLGHVEQDDYTSGLPSYSIYKDEHQNDYAILGGLGLLGYSDTGYFEVKGNWQVKVMAHYVSPLGISFAEACGVRSEGPAPRPVASVGESGG